MASIKKICIITNFRCASTAFNLLKAEEYGVPYKGELFSHEKTFDIGNTDKFKKFSGTRTNENFYAELKNNESVECCFKIMPVHTQYDVDFLIDIAKATDKVYYLYRRDFLSQLTSYIAIRAYGNAQKTGFRTNVGFNQREERARQLVLGTLGEEKTYELEMSLKDRELNGLHGNIGVKMLRRQLIRNYEVMAEAYKIFPGELICKEDYFTEEKYKPYNRKVTWNEDPNFEDFDVEGLFI